MLNDVKEKISDTKEWLKKTSEKYFNKSKVIDNNSKVRNFIIIPDGGIIMASENSDLSHKDILRKLMFGGTAIHNAIMNYPSGYYQSGKIVLFQGDMEQPETLKPLTNDNHSLIKDKMTELKKMLKCGDKISVHFHKGKENTSVYLQAKFDKIREIVNSLLHAKAKSELAK